MTSLAATALQMSFSQADDTICAIYFVYILFNMFTVQYAFNLRYYFHFDYVFYLLNPHLKALWTPFVVFYINETELVVLSQVCSL